MRTRLALGVAGLLVAAYGVHRLLTRQDAAAWVEVAAFLVAGVLVHDAVLAPLSLAAGALVARAVPAVARPAVTAGAVVLGSVTLLAVPVLGRFGARPDNPTLLDRPYLAGWLALTGVVLLGVAAGTLVASRRPQEGGGGGAGAGR